MRTSRFVPSHRSCARLLTVVVAAVLLAVVLVAFVCVALVFVVVAGVSCGGPGAVVTTTGPGSTGTGFGDAVPTLVDLGSVTCVPCKLMAPELQALSDEYAGRLNVVVMDVNEDQAAASTYKIQFIPTQVFLDPSGKELYRHVGFYSKVDMVNKWGELGFDLGSPAVSK